MHADRVRESFKRKPHRCHRQERKRSTVDNNTTIADGKTHNDERNSVLKMRYQIWNISQHVCIHVWRCAESSVGMSTPTDPCHNLILIERIPGPSVYARARCEACKAFA